jgi:pimeloyl-ACP methyl ester carboxylesterase
MLRAWRSRRAVVWLGAVMAALLCAGAGAGVGVGGAGALATPAAGVVSRSVEFTVRNVNRSRVPCAADGQTYVISGRLIGPASATPSSATSSATLYLHGLGFTGSFWDFQAVGGYDYAAALAAAGEESVVIDRLGYGASGHPNGTAICVGSQADMAHQVIGQLRAGSYTVTDGNPMPFTRIALAGHSAGGLIAQVEAYSFQDINALAVVSFADLGASMTAVTEFAKTGFSCAQGGHHGYAFFGQTSADYANAMFHDADPAVVAAATATRPPDPCGDTSSVPLGIVADLLGVPTIKVPVLLVFGANDALFPPPAGQVQRLLYLDDLVVSVVTLPSTGHAVTLGRSAPSFEATMTGWLHAHGL